MLHFSKETKTEEKALTRNAKEAEKREENRNRNPFIDTKCAGEKYFRIKGRTIRYMGHRKLTQLLSSLPISVGDTTSLKLVNVPGGSIGLGVIDSKFRSQREAY